jgi:bidirectional [NiFe] hydrogenase diaphorase subunit
VVAGTTHPQSLRRQGENLVPSSIETRPAKTASQHPSGDRRFKMLEVTMKRHQYRQDALIEVLHAAQGLFGYLEFDVLYFIARQLKLPPARVYGTVTFYHLFRLKPEGEHTCVVCTGTACYVKGADALLEAVGQEANVKPGETTADGRLSLLMARCLGTCGIAPAVVLDGTIMGQVTPEALVRDVKGWLNDGSDGST